MCEGIKTNLEDLEEFMSSTGKVQVPSLSNSQYETFRYKNRLIVIERHDGKITSISEPLKGLK